MSNGTEKARAGYRVLIKPTPWREIMKLDGPVQVRLFDAMEALEANPRPSGVRKLAGYDDRYRIRVGDYRIIYQIQDDVLIVVVVAVGHRREVYR